MKCPFCAEEISDNALRCDVCAEDLTGPAPASEPQNWDIGERILLPVGRSGLAIAAGYCGLFALIPCFAPIALIVSIMAAVQLKKNPELYGWGRTVFGLVTGGVFTIVLIVMGIAMAAGG